MLIEAAVVAAAGMVTAIFRWKREKIRADRDKALAALALDGSQPSERGKIIDSLAKTRQFGHISVPWRSRSETVPPPADDTVRVPVDDEAA